MCSAPSSGASLTWHRLAPECLATLVNDSATIRNAASSTGRGNVLTPSAASEKNGSPGPPSPRAFAVSLIAPARSFRSSADGRTTRQAVELRLRLHAFPHLGLNEIQPSTIQGWLRTLSDLAPTYRKVNYANVSTVFTAAIDDSLITKNPCKAPSVGKPKSDPRTAVPWTKERALAVRDELPERYRLAAWLEAGLGLRQGEFFGLSPDDIDLDRGEVYVRRQVKLLGGNAQVFGLPKDRKTRKVPLPHAVLEAINVHMTAHPPVDVTLPWEQRDRRPTTVSLLLYSREKKALNRNYFNTFLWKPALTRAGVEPTVRTAATLCGTSMPAPRSTKARRSRRSASTSATPNNLRHLAGPGRCDRTSHGPRSGLDRGRRCHCRRRPRRRGLLL